jgi:hypothetical protein
MVTRLRNCLPCGIFIIRMFTTLDCPGILDRRFDSNLDPRIMKRT